jgi:LysR family transcriptional regulator, regulator for bpeEF and oprC
MELSRLRAFTTVVQSGSFTRAAEVLRSQKAGVSRQVSELETELGVRLLERTTRALRLTEIGREVFERALGILNAVEDTERVAQAVHGEPHGLLRMTVPLEFGLIAAFDWVRALLSTYPQLAIEVDSSSRIVDLVHEGYDLAIRIGPLADSRLAARKLGELHYALYAAPTYLQRRGTPTHPDQLAHHDLIAFSPGGKPAPMRLLRDAHNIEIALDVPRLRVDSRYAQRDALLAGLGIAENLTLIAEPEVAAGRLQRIMSDWSRAPVPVHAVFPSHRFLTPKVRAFVEYAQSHFPAMANG